MNAFRPSRHGSRRPRVSFEFFPPKTAEMEETLQKAPPRGKHWQEVAWQSEDEE